ncbi:MAG: methyltransferase domain-containing protein [Candidatus Heimdallarchaeota archaeon]|nr:methyltransferase domain-containing protein [Candidatus Heimdallarchaeota archaeon]
MNDFHYSSSWYDTFMPKPSDDQTLNEVNFIVDHLPMSSYQTILDVCCGIGRHSINLAKKGYEVTGIDINQQALNQARAYMQSEGVKVNFLQKDMRKLSMLQGYYDAILSLWQSFGFFDQQTNERIVHQINQKLSPKGRFILDIFNQDFFVSHQGRYEFERRGIHITETKTIAEDRLTVQLKYHELTTQDTYSFQIFSPKEIMALIEKCGFMTLVKCTHFNALEQPSANHSRMQFVFEKNE